MKRRKHRQIERRVEFLFRVCELFIAHPIACAENGCIVQIRGRNLLLFWHEFEFARYIGRAGERWVVVLPHRLVWLHGLKNSLHGFMRDLPYSDYETLKQKQLPLEGGSPTRRKHSQ